MNGVCAVTGASGYVGARVAASLRAQGWTVTTAGRRDADVGFDLADPQSRPDLSRCDALVHLSYDFSPRRTEDVWRVNVEGTRRLLEAAAEAGISRLVYISSTAAYAGARSDYGRAKLAIEADARRAGAVIVRPGLVWGDAPGAMFGSLTAIVARLPVVPLLISPGQPMLMVCDEDLGELIGAALTDHAQVAGRIVVAGSRVPITFGALLAGLARAQGRRPRFVRVPWRVAWAALRALEAVGVTPPFRSDSLVSIAAVNPDVFAEQTADAASLGVTFRAYPG